MTAIDFTAPPVTTRLRLTVRGRRVLAAVVAFPVAAALGVGILSGGVALASRADSAPAGSFETVTVLAGESLWTIAQEVAPSADPRDVVDQIVRLNALEGTSVSAGQRLAVPAEYSAGS
ncbi:LysM peptidoglycan-binding domain-containing protein [Microbacterium sp. cx-55]|uniref:LysM peptidoglycan-binding domain-containing protein n=1 Tax=unclassified Microbacterium TaxID=2609290 RepID=UPI001CC1372F|nr:MULTISPECIES: LysM peptidoglycan-binding domain-containing protein [unclassified Microbacterium]MBZ4488625.1 LysM peptidoglycan-binding domain-containing protein [Microbacterium sp. cx-55]MCC4909766.1 LysM peptidoglycan-binding domain-containing protein [Microbacterium sp. cx-59]UGB36202.1 LysM peptidoglycan-binding domain-containing protein [Microbacterium sp. cx-55]